jgi:hypothetical protein
MDDARLPLLRAQTSVQNENEREQAQKRDGNSPRLNEPAHALLTSRSISTAYSAPSGVSSCLK